MRRACLLVLAAHLIGALGSAAVYYVATGGSDASAGSRVSPFRTLMRGVEAANAGDTVIVRSGRYGAGNTITGGDASENNQSPVVLRKSGTAEAWITIRSETKWGAVLDCEMRCDAYIDLYNAAYIVIQGFVITNGYKEGIHSNDRAHHIAIRGNRVEYIANRPSSTGLGLDGMYTNAHCHDFIIDGNIFHDIGRTNRAQLDHGLYLHGSDMSVTNNIFYNIPHGWSIQTADGLHDVVIAHNVFAFKNADGNTGQIMLWQHQSGLVIRNNIFYAGERYAIVQYRASIAACAIDHNLVYGASAVMSSESGCAVGANQIGRDPLFVSSSREPYDFHLQAGSPAIGAGAAAGVGQDFDDVARPSATADIGAFTFTRSGR